MNTFKSRSARPRFPAAATVAAAVGILILNLSLLADELQTSGNSNLQKSVSAQAAKAVSETPAGYTPVRVSYRWKSSPRRGTSSISANLISANSNSANQTLTMQFVSANRPAPADEEPKSRPAEPAEANPSATASQLSEKQPVPAVVTIPVLSATERFKQALEEQRRAHEASVESAAQSETQHSETQNSETLSSAAAEIAIPVPSQSLLTHEDPGSDEGLERAKAARFLLLKMQLQQLKSRLSASENNLPQSTNHPPVAEIANPESSPTSGVPLSTNQAAGDHAVADHGLEAGSNSNGGEHKEIDHTTDESDRAADDSLHSAQTDHAVPDSQHAASAPVAVTTQDTHPAMPQYAVVDGPIDRLGLANNLYAVGEYLLAMEMYEQADAAEMTAQQQIWAEYQIANCLRRIGRKAEASSHYRRLAAQPESGWLSVQSKWWGDVLEQTRQLENSLAEHDPGISPTADTSTPHHAGHPPQISKESQHGKHSR